MKKALVSFLLVSLVAGVKAHEVVSHTSIARAMVVQLQYADSKPFAFEAYEVYASGSDRPFHVGRTDHEGRAVFLPLGSGELRLRAFSADGHGLDLRFQPDGLAPSGADRADEDRFTRILLGIGVVLALFGAVQLFFRKRG